MAIVRDVPCLHGSDSNTAADTERNFLPGNQLYRIVCSQGEMALLGNDGWWAGISVAGGRAREEELYRIHYVNYRRTIDY